jgi:hypothetical protein
MTRQLEDHHNTGTPCPVCAALVTEVAVLRESLEDVSLALHNATVERDAAQQEAARLPHPHYSAAELGVDEWAEAHA